MLMAMVFGALVATFLDRANHWFDAPTRLFYAPAGVPSALRFALLIMAILVLKSGIQDAAAALRLSALRLRTSERPLNDSLSAAGPRIPGETVKPAERSSATGVEAAQPRAWMRGVLVAAGVYNLLWGAWVVFFPAALFRWTGMAPINYPQIWQCVGMLVGVYGIGYLIAARNPLRHWPIVLVGLTGKVLGPAGMCWSVTRGGLPANMAWTCLANDLLWWAPFAAILARAFINQRKAPLRNYGCRLSRFKL